MKWIELLKTKYGVISLIVLLISFLFGFSRLTSLFTSILVFYVNLIADEKFIDLKRDYFCVALSHIVHSDSSMKEREKYFLIDFSVMSFLSLLIAVFA